MSVMILPKDGRSAESTFTPVRRFAEHGFTLVEMMVALLIFGLLAAAGAALLSFSVRAQAATGAKLDDIAAVQRLSSAMAADLAQAQNRSTRDQNGATVPAFVGASDASVQPMLSLVRGGWTNLDDAPRAGAQRVDYALDNGTLLRIAYTMLDGAAPLAPAALLTGVTSVKLRYRLAGGWADAWTPKPGTALPDAMEMTVTRRDGTVLRFVFLVGTGYVQPLALGQGLGGGGDGLTP